MMKTDILLLKGTPYEKGFASGAFFKSNIHSDQFKTTPLQKHPKLKDKCLAMMNKLKLEYPDYYEETIGKADGLEMDRLDYFSLMCPELFSFGFEHCTTIIARKENGHFILSHNEDDLYIDGNFCMSKIYLDDQNWFMTNDMLNMPFGNGISYNSYGIVKTINYTHEEHTLPEYLPRYYGQRHISEAKSLDDLIKRCKEIKTASGFHVTAVDINTLKAVSVEVYPESISVIEINDLYVHTNHYIHHDHYFHQVTDQGSNSIFRLNKASELMKNASRTVKSIKQVLQYRGQDNLFETSILQVAEDPYLTLFNFTIDTESPDMLFLDVNISDEHLLLLYHDKTDKECSTSSFYHVIEDYDRLIDENNDHVYDAEYMKEYMNQ